MAFDLDQEVIKHVDWRVLILKNSNRQHESSFHGCVQHECCSLIFPIELVTDLGTE